MNVLTKARLVYRGADVLCVKESLRCGLTPIYVPSVSTGSEHCINFRIIICTHVLPTHTLHSVDFFF
jgi:hypothetical protein